MEVDCVEWSGVEWSGLEWTRMEWSGVEWSGVGVEWKWTGTGSLVEIVGE